jgi:hypothetical protein
MSALRVPTAVLIAWALFVVAWFLPVHREVDGWVPGVEAFVLALNPEDGAWWQRSLSRLTALSNGLVLVSLLMLLRRRAARLPAWLTWSFLIATILDSWWAWERAWRGDVAGLRIGYWLWLASFAAMTLALAASRRRERVAAAV